MQLSVGGIGVCLMDALRAVTKIPTIFFSCAQVLGSCLLYTLRALLLLQLSFNGIGVCLVHALRRART